MRAVLPSAFAVLILLATPGAAPAQQCEIPLFIKQASVDANVMFLFDNSGSMNETMYHPNYDPGTSYSGNFNTTRMYYIRSDRYYTPRNFNRRWPRMPRAFLINSDNGQSGRYIGNYLNWIYFHADDTQRSELPLVTRIQVSKVVVNDVIDRSSERIRFGVTTFHLYGPGNIIGNCGTNRTALHAVVNGVTANTWTPLGESMETLLDYFASDLPSAPIQEACQHNFVVVMTDGYPTMDLDVSSYLVDADGDGNDPGNCTSIGAPYSNSNDCSDHLDDVAYYMYQNDLRPDLGEPGESGPDGQNVVTYTIGFGIDASILQDTAANGDGLYFLAEDAAELAVAFDRVLQDIILRISSGAAVAVISSEQGDDDRLFRGKFMPGSWEGYLEAYSLPYEQGAEPVWEAGQILGGRSSTDRDIYTALGEVRFDFTPGNASDLMSAMEVPDEETAADVINWARGEDVPGYRGHNGRVLGDIVHSTPVVVGAPSLFSTDEDYQSFLAYYSSRPKMIYVGANDGMLHAFYANDGWEAWAFVPEFALPKLHDVADSSYCHLYTCDQTPSVRDVKIGGTWRTVLVAGGGRGGSSYFAIDVTEATAPEILWQVDLPDGKSFASEAEFAQIDGTPVVLIGSGLDEDTGKAYIYTCRVDDGTLLGSRLLSDAGTDRNKVTRPRAVDLDLDDETDLVYCADLMGHLWRADVNEEHDPDGWSMSALFDGDQAITATPAPAYGDENMILVYFGTGAYMVDDDLDTMEQNSFYCVYDRQDGGSHSRWDLVDQTSTISDIGEADGWYVDLWHESTERVTEQAVVVAGAVLFTSFAPGSDVCVAGGRSWLHRMSYDDGSELEDEEGNNTPRDEELEEGFASRPVVDLVNEEVIIQSSNATITVEDIGATYFHLSVRSWQENYDHANGSAGDGPPDIQ